MDIKEFLPELRRMIHGPLQLVMADELFSSAITFCKEAQVIRELLSAGDQVKGDEFDITSTTTGITPWGVVTVYNDDGELKRDVHYVQHSRGKLNFLDDIKDVKVLAWFIPTDRSVIPDSVKPYGEEISHGAASKLFLYPSKPWSDGSQASYHRRLFVEGYRDVWREQLDQYGTFQNPKTNNSYWV